MTAADGRRSGSAFPFTLSARLLLVLRAKGKIWAAAAGAAVYLYIFIHPVRTGLLPSLWPTLTRKLLASAGSDHSANFTVLGPLCTEAPL